MVERLECTKVVYLAQAMSRMPGGFCSLCCSISSLGLILYMYDHVSYPRLVLVEKVDKEEW